MNLHAIAKAYGCRPSDLIHGPMGHLAFDTTVLSVASKLEDELDMAMDEGKPSKPKMIARGFFSALTSRAKAESERG